MKQEFYMEAIIKSMARRKDGFEEWSATMKENYFKEQAQTHNPPIPESDIQRFWNNNSHRV